MALILRCPVHVVDNDSFSKPVCLCLCSYCSEDQRRQLAIITLDDLEWSLEQLETIQIHKSVGDLATNKVRRCHEIE